MKEYASLVISNDWESGDYSGPLCMKDADFTKLSSLFPSLLDTDDAGKQKLYIEAQVSDPVFQSVWKFVLDHGYKPLSLCDKGLDLERGEFFYKIKREFTDEELLQAPYLYVCLQKSFAGGGGGGLVNLTVSNEKWTGKKFKVANIGLSQWYCVSKEGRAELEALGFQVSFRDILNRTKDFAPVPGFFEIQGSVRLPPLKGMQIKDLKYGDYNGDPTKSWSLYERYYHEPQLCFDRAEFEKLAPFDLGFTSELLYHHPWPVCSNRLFRFFRKHDKKCTAIPIRLA